MIAFLLITFGTALILALSIWSQSVVIASSAGFICLTYLVLLGYDLLFIRKLIAEHLLDKGPKAFLGAVRFNTSLADSFNDHLMTAKQRLAYLEDEVLSNYLRARSIPEKTQSSQAIVSPATFTEEQQSDPVVQRLAQLQTSQRAAVAVYICFHTKTKELRLFGAETQGKRFKSQIESKYLPYFEQQLNALIGLFDSAKFSDMSSNFESYGVRYYSAIPAGENLSGWQGLLWLGFSNNSYPELNQRFEIVEAAKELLRLCISTQELQVLSAKVLEAEQQKMHTEQFVAHLSHDIRSPLHNVKTVLSLVKQEELAVHEKQQLMQVALKNCDTLEGLVTDILDYNKHSVGQLSAKKELFNLTELLKDIKNNYIFTAKSKGLNFKFKAPKQDVLVCADQRQLKRIFSNLISNAIKFCSAGQIEISLVNSINFIQVNISDSGCGMTPTQILSAFEPFSRYSENQPGVGLGLTVCKLLTELNSGQIEIFSDGLNGTTIKLVFPQVAENLASKNLPELINVSKNQILVINPNKQLISEYKTTFTSLGLDILEADTYEDAVAICNFDLPDIIMIFVQNNSGSEQNLFSYLQTRPLLPKILVAEKETAESLLTIFCLPLTQVIQPQSLKIGLIEALANLQRGNNLLKQAAMV